MKWRTQFFRPRLVCCALVALALGGCQAAPVASGDPTQQPLIRPTIDSGQPSPAASPSSVTGSSLAAQPEQTLLDAQVMPRPAGWPDTANGPAHFVDGGYQLAANEHDRFVAIRAPLADTVRDAVVTGRFRKIGGPAGGGYGLIVRDQSPQPLDGVQQSGRFYVVEAGDLGEVGIWRREGERWVDLLAWSKARAVHPGNEVNEIVVRAAGSALSVSVNGTQLVSVNDTTLADGGIGVFAGGDGNQVVLEHLGLQRLSP